MWAIFYDINNHCLWKYCVTTVMYWIEKIWVDKWLRRLKFANGMCSLLVVIHIVLDIGGIFYKIDLSVCKNRLNWLTNLEIHTLFKMRVFIGWRWFFPPQMLFWKNCSHFLRISGLFCFVHDCILGSIVLTNNDSGALLSVRLKLHGCI